MTSSNDSKTSANWTFLSNHSHVLVCIAGNSELRIRDIAQLVGITERAVAEIIGDLEDGGYLKRVKQGRRNTYVLNKKGKLRHELENKISIGKILDLFGN